ncbi:SDR family NAD(P)-dependent oxidoreductase [Frigidibacter sp. ROC022]|uniref:SDR family NAD(P)-dependent oxidoreductase n=1 Tax=Frigidibacter sp. ROC022 TaxID=2971796 RepID=UPI00215B6C87|nr:SDR family oxidoreductase [Frigidibacter sp. ROC022]MCR8726698.1 SDR family oxidoreductase [Frigidibacter sp. ROC022]
MQARFPDLKDRSVFITGGASGIGAAITRGFAAQGARVAFCDLKDGRELCDRIEAEHGNRPLSLPCNVTETAALHQVLEQAAGAHGPITVLVNLAAYDERHDTLEVTPDYWRKMMARNLDHVFFASQAVIPGMIAAGGGRIVNFSSISYVMGMGDYPAYTASKAGITALTRGMARQFGPDSIRVNAVLPGWVLTERQVELWATPETLEDFLKKQCLKRHMAPEDMIDPVLFLASDASAMVTGQALAVDGGVVVSG